MSGYQVHALCGAVGGLALARALSILDVTATLVTPHSGLVPSVALPPGVLDGLIVAGSAFVALLPDIDEGGSWVARRAKLVVSLACAPIGAIIGYSLSDKLHITGQPLAAAVVGALVALGFVGPLLGVLLLKLIRWAAGGHRRFTHSYVLAGVLAAVAVIAWRIAGAPWALLPGALAWGIFLHTIADLVTPAGVPLFYPASEKPFFLLPKGLRHMGEPIVTSVALVAGALLSGVVHF